MANMSVRVSPKTRAQLDQIAANLDRSRNWVINVAINEYIELNAWQVARIRERLKQAESGEAEFIPHEQVMAEVEKLLNTKTK